MIPDKVEGPPASEGPSQDTASPLPRRESSDILEPRLLDVERYVPKIDVGLMLRLPGSNALDFFVAASLGSTLNVDGTRGKMRDRENGGGVYIGPAHRKRVLAVLGITGRRWRQLLDDWESRYVAHRCDPRNAACLFTRPLLGECPSCKKLIEVHSAAPEPDRKKRQAGRNRSPKTEASVPESGSNASGKAEGTLPAVGRNISASRHELVTPSRGNLLGDKEGIAAFVLKDGRACVRCQRYGGGHVGEHRSAWAGVG